MNKYYKAFLNSIYGIGVENIEERNRIYKMYLREFKYPKIHKALEIIKQKGINMMALIMSNNFDEYNDMILYHTGMMLLSKKEYVLLKEVLFYKQ